MDSFSATGFAIRRNNTCLGTVGEVDCGNTWADLRACCPSGGFCPSTRDPDNYNTYCCTQANTNCTTQILDTGPYCANSTWTLYDNAGYFCCAPGTSGFSNSTTSGCADPGVPKDREWTWLDVVGAKAKPTSSSSSTSSVAASASASSPANDSNSSSSNIGAIVGGVIGGVIVFVAIVAIIVFMLRRSKKRKDAGPGFDASHDASAQPKFMYMDNSDRGSMAYTELGTQGQQPVELPASSKPPVSELRGS